MGYHNILKHGFTRMHGTGSENLKSLKRSFDEAESMTATEYVEASVLPSTSTELYIRALRVKAFRTLNWLDKSETIFKLLMTAVTVQPAERIMYKFLQWQHQHCGLDATASPLARMTSDASPARKAVDELLTLMVDGKFLFSDNTPGIADTINFLEFARNLVKRLEQILSLCFNSTVQRYIDSKLSNPKTSSISKPKV